MSGELEKKLIEYLNGVQQATKGAVDFVSEHAPGYATELLTYKTYMESIDAVLFTLLFFGLIYGTYKLCRWMWEKDEDTMPGIACIVVLSVIINITFLCTSVSSVQTIIKIKTAPKVYIADHIAAKLESSKK